MIIPEYEFAKRHIEVMYKIASRQISFDKILINDISKNIKNKLINSLRLLNSSEPIGENLNHNKIHEIIKIKNVKQEELEVYIFVIPRDYLQKRKFLIPESDTDQNVIRLFIDKMFTPQEFFDNIGNLQPEIYSNLIHEITHNMDVLKEEVGYENYNVHGYINSPSEIKAFLSQIIYDLERTYGNLQKLRDDQKNYIIKNLQEESDVFYRLYFDLDDKNKNYIYEAVYNELFNPKEKEIS